MLISSICLFLIETFVVFLPLHRRHRRHLLRYCRSYYSPFSSIQLIDQVDNDILFKNLKIKLGCILLFIEWNNLGHTDGNAVIDDTSGQF